MKLKDVPHSPAYLVWHDAYDNGMMDVWPAPSVEEATREAEARNDRNDETGDGDAGFWKGYTKLPRKKVFKYHPVSTAFRNVLSESVALGGF